jgi:hypothetical protein
MRYTCVFNMRYTCVFNMRYNCVFNMRYNCVFNMRYNCVFNMRYALCVTPCVLKMRYALCVSCVFNMRLASSCVLRPQPAFCVIHMRFCVLNMFLVPLHAPQLHP